MNVLLYNPSPGSIGKDGEKERDNITGSSRFSTVKEMQGRVWNERIIFVGEALRRA
jgi:hypothetical protein